MRPFFLLFLFLSILSFGCKRDKSNENQTTNAAISENFINESYGSDIKQRFDIYLPANRSIESTPILFLIHGGGWTEGDKSNFNSALIGFRTAFPSYAIVTVGYRLCSNGNNRFPVQEMDVKACIEHIMQHREYYHISDSFGLWGVSAGAHLAMLYAYKYGHSSFAPKAVVEFAGPTDLIRMYNETSNDIIRLMISTVAGDIHTNDSLIYVSSSPIHYINESSTPTMIIHGDADVVVDVSQSQYLQAKLEEHGVDYEYHIYPGEGHGLTPNAMNSAIVEAVDFLHSRVGN